MALRRYQMQAVGGVKDWWRRGFRRVCIVAPTGAGKTQMAVALLEPPVLWLAPWRPLVDQAGRRLAAEGLQVGTLRRPADVVVATYEGLARSGTPKGWRPRTIVVDEAHRADTRRRREAILQHSSAHVVGLTATPWSPRGGLGHVFEKLVAVPYLSELVAEGYLAEPVVYAADPVDLDDAPVVRGDYRSSDVLARGGQRLVGDAVAEWQRLCPDARTVAYGLSTEHARELARRFEALGVRTGFVCASTPARERDRVLRELEDGTTQVVTNYGVLVEGFDAPIDAVIARPTASLTVWWQSAGRALRRYGDKTQGLVLDPGGNVFRFGLPGRALPYSLDGEPEAQPPEVRWCSKCGRVLKDGGCRACGTVATIVRPVQERQPPLEVPARLELVSAEGRERLAVELRAIARSTGYGAEWLRMAAAELGLDPGEVIGGPPRYAPRPTRPELWDDARARAASGDHRALAGAVHHYEQQGGEWRA